MHIERGPSLLSSRLRARAVDARLEVTGLTPGTLASAIGMGHTRFAWKSLYGQSPLVIDNPSAPQVADGPFTGREFDDGHVNLASGAPGSLAVEEHHRPSDQLLLPTSLHLLLAQQWARGGAMPMHAAALKIGERGILVLGRRGAGKSVLGVATILAGGGLISDDWLLAGTGADDRPVIERIRNFIMLRQGWASQRLLSQLPGLRFQPHRTRPKLLFRLDDTPDRRFPLSTGIDEIWILSRPARVRQEHTKMHPAPASAALAGLISASVPLLYGARFPHERAALLRTCRHLLATASCHHVETGLDLVNQPRQVLARLTRQDIERVPETGSLEAISA